MNISHRIIILFLILSPVVQGKPTKYLPKKKTWELKLIILLDVRNMDSADIAVVPHII